METLKEKQKQLETAKVENELLRLKVSGGNACPGWTAVPRRAVQKHGLAGSVLVQKQRGMIGQDLISKLAHIPASSAA